MASKGASTKFSEDEVTAALMAMIAWAGNATAASRYLRSEKDITVSATTLNQWKSYHYADRYNELRDKYTDQLESQLAHELRDVARFAVEVERLALEKAQQRLLANEDTDPARSAANIARVKQSATDKLLSLTGRPTRITESRDLKEILRSLAARGVIDLPDAPQLEAPAEEATETNGAS